MRSIGKRVVWSLTAWCLVAVVSPGRGEEARLLDRGRWRDQAVQTVGQLEGFRPADEVKPSRYGGLAGRKVKATGFFRTEQVDRRWWLVDPDGCLFISVGLCSVNHSGVDETLVGEKFGDRAGWAEATGNLLKSYGFNTLGCWSDWRVFRSTPARMPYTPRWNFMSTYKNRRPEKNGPRGFPHETMPVFDPEFETFCDEHAKQLAAGKEDPWLLGHFSDNELPLRRIR